VPFASIKFGEVPGTDLLPVRTVGFKEPVV
jgi:hypothetical protein